MQQNFQIRHLSQDFNFLFSADETELAKHKAIKMVVSEKPGTPCRISLEDAEIGEEVVLFNYTHHKTDSPFHGSGPIFIRKEAKPKTLAINEVPEMLNHRLLSLRVYNKRGMLIDATTVQGTELKNALLQLFENEKAEYIHIHNSSQGCFHCQVDRAIS